MNSPMKSKSGLRKALRAKRGVALAALALGASACSYASEEGDAEDVGSLEAAITVSGLAINSVEVRIADEEATLDVSRVRTLNVTDPNASLTATEGGLPPGRYRVGLFAHPVDIPGTPLDESGVVCEGAVSGVKVEAGKVAQVPNLVLLCTVDGGQVQVAGGISIDADVAIKTVNTCGDLVAELSVAPLRTSVNESVKLDLVTSAEDVQVEWSARAGTVALDGTSYTCPAVAGTYAVTAKLSRADGCSQSFTQNVQCKNRYSGQCEPLPEAFGLSGSCSFGAFPESPCSVQQDGCEFSMHCGGDEFGSSITGEGKAGDYAFILPDGAVCTGSMDGKLSGSCVSPQGQSCDFVAEDKPKTSPFCTELPVSALTELSDCGVSYSRCEFFQDGCLFQASCDDGKRHVGGEIIGDKLGWWSIRDGFYYECAGALDGGKLDATCEPWIGHAGVPLESCEVDANVVPREVAPICDETLPAAGFKLQGCGFDDICFATQTGCSWSLNCGGQLKTGVTDLAGDFTFTHQGQDCVGRVQNGEFVGSCSSEGASCSFAPVPVAPPNNCFALPARMQSTGCGPSLDCVVVQDGCEWQASCNGGQIPILGTAEPTGIDFAGRNGYSCYADLSPAGDRLLGNCSIAAPDGTTSSCFDLTPVQGAPLAIKW
jgi:hypothetical protein